MDPDVMVNAKLRWGIEQRLEFIEFVLFWEGMIKRADLVDRFGVSVPQASADIKRYRETAPDNAEYDGQLKRYIATDAFAPVLINPDADDYLSFVSDGEGQVAQVPYAPPCERLNLPERQILPGTLRFVVAAIREGLDIRIRYQSMSRPKPIWRWITPHALGDNGRRWHFRAYCHIDGEFKDFLFSRIMKTGETRLTEIHSADDKDWYDEVTFVLVPNPQLSKTQQQVIAHDYGMKNGKLSITTNPAMLSYYLRHLGIDDRNEISEALLILERTERL